VGAAVPIRYAIAVLHSNGIPWSDAGATSRISAKVAASH